MTVPTAAAESRQSARPASVRQLDRMMVALSKESARDARAIRKAYKSHLDLLVLDEYAALEEALSNGGIAPLPADPGRYNLAPRLSGASPIGQMDLAHQVSYIAARPATIGALLDIASRVKSGAVEITSLVRHTEYQGALRSTNANAMTSVPMHTMGLAFDIALVNTPLETVYEIRDVLRRMRRAGEILFIGERRQLVFHVVPHPSKLGHFTEVYARALGAPAAASSTHVVAFGSPSAKSGRTKPNVSAEVVAVLPADEFAEEWWAADHEHGDLTVQVTAAAAVATAAPEPAPVPVRRFPSLLPLGLVAALVAPLAAMASRTASRRTSIALGLTT